MAVKQVVLDLVASQGELIAQQQIIIAEQQIIIDKAIQASKEGLIMLGKAIKVSEEVIKNTDTNISKDLKPKYLN